ncbi:hypothetical protein [Noviherbaspirillum pedocola]|uniref:Uncharacterized protein n=1 Tax=Noviherbaspirillum pedocola TaxID=2801341 RepID=A0A934SVN9_9BURK|nr:hypothetical protein [Noviherbaspirillum pedocola]MBK4736218.1 hypothetical protein [Noviherbaspirillum pedocola]
MNKATEVKTLQIHAVAVVPREDLDEDDREIPGTYEVTVQRDVSDGLAAWAALEAFHEKNGVEVLEDFEFHVFDPVRQIYLDQEEPTDAEGDSLRYSYEGKLSDELPTMRMRLTLDVSYYVNGTNPKRLAEMLERLAAQGIENGMLTGSSSAQVAEYSMQVQEVANEPQVLSPHPAAESGSDYVLKPEAKSCWISVDSAAVHVVRTDEGVIVDIHAEGSANGAIAGSGATYSEIEDELLEAEGITLEDVEMQYAYDWPHGPAFFSLPSADRACHIRAAAQRNRAGVDAFVRSQREESGQSQPA